MAVQQWIVCWVKLWNIANLNDFFLNQPPSIVAYSISCIACRFTTIVTPGKTDIHGHPTRKHIHSSITGPGGMRWSSNWVSMIQKYIAMVKFLVPVSVMRVSTEQNGRLLPLLVELGKTNLCRMESDTQFIERAFLMWVLRRSSSQSLVFHFIMVNCSAGLSYYIVMGAGRNLSGTWTNNLILTSPPECFGMYPPNELNSWGSFQLWIESGGGDSIDYPMQSISGSIRPLFFRLKAPPALSFIYTIPTSVSDSNMQLSHIPLPSFTLVLTSGQCSLHGDPLPTTVQDHLMVLILNLRKNGCYERIFIPENDRPALSTQRRYVFWRPWICERATYDGK